MELVKTDTFLQRLTVCGVAYIVFFVIFLIFYKRLENMVYNLNMNKWVVFLLFNISTILISLSVYGFAKITQINMWKFFLIIVVLSMLEIAINILSVAKFRDDIGYTHARAKDAKVGIVIWLNILILLLSLY